MTSLSITWRDEVKKGVSNRHFYLRLARQFGKMNQIGDMHTYSQLAEREQIRLDEITSICGMEVLCEARKFS